VLVPRRSIVFLGTPEVAAVVLRGLVLEERRIDLVVTAPDKRRGRGGSLLPTPVKTAALAAGLPVSHDPGDVLTAAGPDTLGVVVAYGRIIAASTVSRLPMLNVHFSLLPRWRGAAPVERAILAGDAETGVCIMRMDEGLDTGNVVAETRVPIGAHDTTDTLLERLARVSVPLLSSCLDLADLTGVPQQGESTYARKIGPDEGDIDWTEPGDMVARRVRALRCHTHLDGRRIAILEVREPTDTASLPVDAAPGTIVAGAHVRAGGDWLRLVEVRPEGRASCSGADWFRGLRDDHPVFVRVR